LNDSSVEFSWEPADIFRPDDPVLEHYLMTRCCPYVSLGTQVETSFWVRSDAEVPKEPDVFEGFVPQPVRLVPGARQNSLAEHAFPVRVIVFDAVKSLFFALLADSPNCAEIDSATLIELAPGLAADYFIEQAKREEAPPF
jgi:hypothetical protein